MSILDKFTVVDLIKTRSASMVTITGTSLKFNPQTAAELQYPPFIQILVNPEEKQIAIRACKESARHAVPFSKPEGEQKYPIKISAAAVTKMARTMGGWNEEDNWNIPGVLFNDELVLIYDVGAAFRPTPRGSRIKKDEE